MNNKVLVYLFVLVLLGSFAFAEDELKQSYEVQDAYATSDNYNYIAMTWTALDTYDLSIVSLYAKYYSGTPTTCQNVYIWDTVGGNPSSELAYYGQVCPSDVSAVPKWLNRTTGNISSIVKGDVYAIVLTPLASLGGRYGYGIDTTQGYNNGTFKHSADGAAWTTDASDMDFMIWDTGGIIPTPTTGTLTNIFNSNSTEDKVENISIRLENYNITSLSNATLIYNNTEYSGAINYQNINNVTFSANVDTPLIYNPEETIYFYWNYTLLYSNGSIENLLSPLENQSITWNLTSYPRINISATNNLLSTPIGNFSINGVPYESNAFIINSAGVHAYTISSFGYETKTENVTFIGGNLTQYTFNLYTRNSISLNILDENTDAPIIENVSIRFYSDIFGEFINYTNSSTFYIDDLNASEYQITLKSGNYSERTYILTVSENSSQSLNAYLSKNLSSTLFTIRDRDTGDTLEDVLLTMYRNINTSWVAVESQYSDITGRAEFTYNLGANYKFFASKDFYTDYVFYLEPILFSEYDVRIIRDIEANNTGDFQGVSIIYSPYSYDNNKNNTFTFIIQSPDGELVYYGYNITTPSGSYTNSGSNAIGGQLNTEVEITGGDYFDKVTIDYYYYTSISGHRDFTANFPINNPNGGNQTFMSNNDKKYGLGLFERVFIITIIIIFIVGIASLVGQPIPGMVLSLFVYGYMAYMGFIELWAIIITIMIGVFFLSWKTGA